MKVNNFDYNTKKNTFFEVFDILVEEDILNDESFCNGAYYKYDNKDINKLINIFEKTSKKSGLNIPEFMETYKDSIYSDYDFQKCGFIDMILYKYDKEKGLLAGYHLNNSSNVEYSIKYEYGYYKYDIGKNFILQSYETFDDYFKDTAKYYLIGVFENYIGAVDDGNILKNQIIKKYRNGYFIFANLRGLFKYSYINNYDEFVSTLKYYISDSFNYDNDIMCIKINIDKFNVDDIDFDEIVEDFRIINASNKYNL